MTSQTIAHTETQVTICADNRSNLALLLGTTNLAQYHLREAAAMGARPPLTSELIQLCGQPQNKNILMIFHEVCAGITARNHLAHDVEGPTGYKEVPQTTQDWLNLNLPVGELNYNIAHWIRELTLAKFQIAVCIHDNVIQKLETVYPEQTPPWLVPILAANAGAQLNAQRTAVASRFAEGQIIRSVVLNGTTQVPESNPDLRAVLGLTEIPAGNGPFRVYIPTNQFQWGFSQALYGLHKMQRGGKVVLMGNANQLVRFEKYLAMRSGFATLMDDKKAQLFKVEVNEA